MYTPTAADELHLSDMLVG